MLHVLSAPQTLRNVRQIYICGQLGNAPEQHNADLGILKQMLALALPSASEFVRLCTLLKILSLMPIKRRQRSAAEVC